MNPAARLLATHDTLKSIGDEKLSMSALWSQVFGLGDAPDENDISVCLLALRSQIAFASTRLAARGVPVEILRYGYKRLHEAASPTLLGNTWGGYRARVVAPECGAEFAWSAWALRDEDEEEMPAAAMQTLRDELEELEQAVANGALTPYLREFISQQIHTIRAALRVYPIRGAKPLQDALKQVVGSFTVEKGQLEKEQAATSPEARGVLAKAAGVIDKTGKVCDSLDKMKKFGDGAWGIAQGVGAVVLPYVAKQLGG